MPPSLSQYKEYLKHRESIQPSQETSFETALGMIKTAAVSFDHLTQSEEWNRYLSMIEARLIDAKKERDRLLSLCGGAVGDALVHAQLQYQNYNGYVRALEEVAMLPHQIMGMYEEVKK